MVARSDAARDRADGRICVKAGRRRKARLPWLHRPEHRGGKRGRIHAEAHVRPQHREDGLPGVGVVRVDHVPSSQRPVQAQRSEHQPEQADRERVEARRYAKAAVRKALGIGPPCRPVRLTLRVG